MDPLLVIWGVMLALGATYWWEQKLLAVMGDSSLTYSFGCLVSGGLNGCPVHQYATLNLDNLAATLLFYVGVGMFLYTIVFPKPPMPPQSQH